MPTVPERLIEISTRHQIFLEGNKTRIVNEFEPFLLDMAKVIDKKLSNKDITDFTKSRYEKLDAAIQSDLTDVYKQHFGVWKEQIVDLADYEAGFEARSLEQVAGNVEYVVPTRQQLYQAAFATPLTGIKDIRGSESLKDFYNIFASDQINKVHNIIRNGYYIGKTTPQIVSEIKGTKALKYQDGQLARTNRDLSAVTRTAVQHAAMQARQETWKANPDVIIGYKIAVTFDSRTSPICIGIGNENKVYKVGEGPVPPLHVNCRSTTVAAFPSDFDFLDEGATKFSRNADGQPAWIDAETTQYSFLKSQPIKFQNEVLGVKRSQLLREGGLSEKDFNKLSWDDKGFRQRTLKEMRELEPLVFERVGL